MPESSPITYHGAHRRVYARHGPAAAQTCACGKPARHWTYDHGDPAELTDPRGRPYSSDPDRYVARCVPCHKRADLARLERPPAQCGTEKGYERHRRDGTPRCRPCKTAHAVAEAGRRAARALSRVGEYDLVQGG